MTSLREKLRDNAYTSTLPIGPKPREPRLPGLKGSTEDQIKIMDAHKDALLAFDSAMSAWKIQNAARRAEENRLDDLFKADLFAELGISDHPKREVLFSKAIERGDSSGKFGVLDAAEELVELLS